MFGNEEEVTRFRCQTRNVQTQTGKLKAVLCARQYVKLPGLYDAAFRVATLGARNVGLVSTPELVRRELRQCPAADAGATWKISNGTARLYRNPRRQGRCRRAHSPSNHFPISVGRAYGNDVILDDPYVCPAHRRDRAGRARAFDRAAIWIASTDCARTRGRSRRRAWKFSPAASFASAIRSCATAASIIHWRRRWWIATAEDCGLNSPYAAVIVGAAVFLLLCLDAYLTTIERVTFAAIVSEPLTTFAMLLLWSGLWALASRVVVSRFHFPQHATIACGAIVGFFLLSFSAEWLEFLFPSVPMLWIAGLFGSGLIMAALVYGHLKFASTDAAPFAFVGGARGQRRRRRRERDLRLRRPQQVLQRRWNSPAF